MNFQSYQYKKVHKWLKINYGKATYCSNDIQHKAKFYDWANISGEYKMDINDFKPLCRACHFKMDKIASKIGLRTLGKKYHNIKIRQYDRNWNFIKEWASSVDVEKTLNVLRTNISNVLAGRSQTAGGWRWSR